MNRLKATGCLAVAGLAVFGLVACGPASAPDGIARGGGVRLGGHCDHLGQRGYGSRGAHVHCSRRSDGSQVWVRGWPAN